jgi:negative regulator of sigma-B (phosphoserine phosphatase)
MRHLREEKMTLTDGDVLVLHTDGVKEHFDLEDYPELLVDDAETVANHIINQFGGAEDDACCIALRYQR